MGTFVNKSCSMRTYYTYNAVCFVARCFLHNYAIEDILILFEDIEDNELNKFTFFFEIISSVS